MVPPYGANFEGHLHVEARHEIGHLEKTLH